MLLSNPQLLQAGVAQQRPSLVCNATKKKNKVCARA